MIQLLDGKTHPSLFCAHGATKLIGLILGVVILTMESTQLR